MGVARWEAEDEGRRTEDWPCCRRTAGDADVFAVFGGCGDVEDTELVALCKVFALLGEVECGKDNETGRVVVRVALRGSGLIGRSILTRSPSQSSSELLTSSLGFVSTFSPQSLSLFLALERGIVRVASIAALALYFGSADGGRPCLGLTAEGRPRNANEARSFAGLSLGLEESSITEGAGGAEDLCDRVAGVGVDKGGGRVVGFGVGLSLPPLFRVTARAAFDLSRIVAPTGFGHAVVRVLVGVLVVLATSNSEPLVVDVVTVDSLSLFMTSARAFPTERVIVREARLERELEGRVGSMIVVHYVVSAQTVYYKFRVTSEGEKSIVSTEYAELSAGYCSMLSLSTLVVNAQASDTSNLTSHTWSSGARDIMSKIYHMWIGKALGRPVA